MIEREGFGFCWLCVVLFMLAADEMMAQEEVQGDAAAAAAAAGCDRYGPVWPAAATMGMEAASQKALGDRIRVMLNMQDETRCNPNYVEEVQRDGMQVTWRRKVAEWLLEVSLDMHVCPVQPFFAACGRLLRREGELAGRPKPNKVPRFVGLPPLDAFGPPAPARRQMRPGTAKKCLPASPCMSTTSQVPRFGLDRRLERWRGPWKGEGGATIRSIYFLGALRIPPAPSPFCAPKSMLTFLKLWLLRRLRPVPTRRVRKSASSFVLPRVKPAPPYPPLDFPNLGDAPPPPSFLPTHRPSFFCPSSRRSLKLAARQWRWP